MKTSRATSATSSRGCRRAARYPLMTRPYSRTNDRKASRLPARTSAMTAAASKPPGGLTIRLPLPLLRESYVAFSGTIFRRKTATMLLISDKGWRWAKPPSVPVATAIEYCRCAGGWLAGLVKMPSQRVRTVEFGCSDGRRGAKIKRAADLGSPVSCLGMHNR